MKYVVAGLIIAALLAWLARGRSARRSGKGQSPSATASRAKTADASATAMLKCAHCGVHLPGAEAIIERGAAYCSDEHRQRGDATTGR